MFKFCVYRISILCMIVVMIHRIYKPVPHTTLRMMKIKKRNIPSQIPVRNSVLKYRERYQIRVTTHSQVVCVNVWTVFNIRSKEYGNNFICFFDFIFCTSYNRVNRVNRVSFTFIRYHWFSVSTIASDAFFSSFM